MAPNANDTDETVTSSTVFTDIDKNPISCDNNPAHYDGLLTEIAAYCKRTGKFLPLLEQGVAIRGHRTIVDSASAVQFVQGDVANAIQYTADRPCPGTTVRMTTHNALPSTATAVSAVTVIPPTLSGTYIVNNYVIQNDDLELGNAIAACFVGFEDYINRERDAHGMGGRALIARLRTLGAAASAPQRALVLRRFTKYAEAAVTVDLNAQLFGEWYKELQKRHRRLPAASRKSDGDICEYINILMYAQPTWRELFSMKMAGSASTGGNLNATLALLREMLDSRDIYAQLDAEQQGGLGANALLVGRAVEPKPRAGSSESSSIKRAFAALVESGNTTEAFAVASQAGFTRASADPKKGGANETGSEAGGGGGGGGQDFKAHVRDASGAITKFTPGGRHCFCDGAHLHRDCPNPDMWLKNSTGKWNWIGGTGWSNGKPPATLDREATKRTGTLKTKTAQPHSAKAVVINTDSDLATQLAAVWEDDAASDAPPHSAKVVSTGERCSECDETSEDPDPGLTVVQLDHSHVDSAVPETKSKAPETAEAAPAAATGVERFLRESGTAAVSSISGLAASAAKSARANSATIFCFAFLFLSVAVLVPLVSVAPNGTNSAVIHPAASSVPTDSVRPIGPMREHGAFAVTVSRARAPSLAESWSILGIFGWLAFTILFFRPCLFWYIVCSFPADIARVTSYCLATPLAALPPVYHAVLGLNRGSLSFFGKTTCSINNLKRFGGPFALLALLAIALSRFSPFASIPGGMALPGLETDVDATIRAPAFADAGAAPAVSNISLPYRGAWLPSELERGGGVVHSYNSALVADNNSATLNGFTSKSISSLPIVAATVDSGCSASCTASCHLLTDTSPCDEVFGAANGVLARATLIGNLPVIARTSDGTFIHFVITNVRCVPEFSNFTLLSVDQMWEEQRVKSLFCDTKQLQLPESGGGHILPYDEAAGRNTLKFASAVQLYETGVLKKQTAANVRHHSAHTALGFHDVKSTSHVAKLSGAQVGELLHRRLHRPVNVVRAAPSTTADATDNLTRAEKVSCAHCATSGITKTSHGGSKSLNEASMLPPCTGPGTLHIDLKGMMVRSVHGYHYAMFAVEEYSRFTFVEFLNTKESREQIGAAARIVARFNKLVNAASTTTVSLYPNLRSPSYARITRPPSNPSSLATFELPWTPTPQSTWRQALLTTMISTPSPSGPSASPPPSRAP